MKEEKKEKQKVEEQEHKEMEQEVVEQEQEENYIFEQILKDQEDLEYILNLERNNKLVLEKGKGQWYEQHKGTIE